MNNTSEILLLALEKLDSIVEKLDINPDLFFNKNKKEVHLLINNGNLILAEILLSNAFNELKKRYLKILN